MNALVRTGIAVLLLSGAGGAAAQTPQPTPGIKTAPIIQDLVTTQAFTARVEDYAAMHRLLEGPMTMVRPTRNMEEVYAAVRALGYRIRQARTDARQGDIITPDAARLFRRSIATCLTPEEWAAIFAENDEEADEMPLGPVPPLRVNMEWPVQALFNFVPPQLLRVLPPLPPELQYRIIGRSLVLWDNHANLIIDFLPNAFTT
jgi:hypothetical protein